MTDAATRLCPPAGDPLAPALERLRLAQAALGALAALHARGEIHGALGPAALAPRPDGAVALVAAAGRVRRGLATLHQAGLLPCTPPEVLRGAWTSRRGDVYAAGALVHALLAGAPPFGEPGATPLEVVRAVLHAPPALLPAGTPDALVRAVAAALRRRPWRRPRLSALQVAVAEALAGGAADVHGPSRPQGQLRARAAAAAARALLDLRRGAARLRSRAPAHARLSRRWAVPAAALTLTCITAAVLLPGGERALASAVEARLAVRDVGGAHALLEAAARDGRSGPVMEKLRGDVACSRGAARECLRRYRLAIAGEPALGADPALRTNARRLLMHAPDCSGRRAAAELLGELRDREALPALEEARRSSGPFRFLCTGDALDRAIAATRGVGGRR